MDSLQSLQDFKRSLFSFVPWCRYEWLWFYCWVHSQDNEGTCIAEQICFCCEMCRMQPNRPGLSEFQTVRVSYTSLKLSLDRVSLLRCFDNSRFIRFWCKARKCKPMRWKSMRWKSMIYEHKLEWQVPGVWWGRSESKWAHAANKRSICRIYSCSHVRSIRINCRKCPLCSRILLEKSPCCVLFCSTIFHHRRRLIFVGNIASGSHTETSLSLSSFEWAMISCDFFSVLVHSWLHFGESRSIYLTRISTNICLVQCVLNTITWLIWFVTTMPW